MNPQLRELEKIQPPVQKAAALPAADIGRLRARQAAAAAVNEGAALLLAWAAWLLKVIKLNLGWAFVRVASAGRLLLHWLDPRVHFELLRVRAVSEGRLIKNDDKVAVLVLYNVTDGLPPFIESFIDAIGRSEFDLVVVSNADLDAELKSSLLQRSRLLVERLNIGRDFGAYKDGIAIIRRAFPRLRRLLLANDSVFYLPHGLDEVLDRLASEDDFVGISEVFEHHYHIASFLVSFGKAVLDSAAFWNFWVRYRPICARRWAILRGEGALTETLIAAGFQPRALYTVEALHRSLRGCPAERLLEETQILPEPTRGKLIRKWNKRDHGASTSAVEMADDIADAIKAHNQMHHGGFLFRRHLGLPIVKRDLVYRKIYPLQDALANLSDVEAPLLVAIGDDLRGRAAPEEMGLLRRLFHRHGAI